MSQNARVEAAVRQGSADYFRDADAQGGAYGEWVKSDRSKACPQILNGDLARYITRSVVATLAAADRLAPDTAAALGEDDAKFLDQVATMVSRNDGDPPNSEGIMALKLRAIAATIRKAGPA